MRGSWLAGVKVGRRSVLDELWRSERERPHRPLLRWREGEWSVSDFASQVRGAAASLRWRGVSPGQRVAVLASNTESYFALVYGIYAAGAVEVPVNSELRGPMLRHVLEDADPTLIVAEERYLEAVVHCGAERAPVVRFDEEFLESWAEAPVIDLADPSPDQLATVMYTSGTTGPSKGVMLPHGFFPNNGQNWQAAIEVRDDDVLYFFLPFFHADAHVLLATCVSSRSVFSFAPRFSASRFWIDVRDFGTTWSLSIGAALDVLAAAEPPPDPDKLAMNRCYGAPISTAAYEFFEERLGIALHEAYGQTEADSVAYGTADRRRRGSLGWPCAGFDVAILGPGGDELGPGQRGEIAYRPGAANMVLQGYWRREEATVAAFRDLWFHTGDIGWLDEGGFLWFGGRMKDHLRRRGENISAFELEATVNQAPGVSASAAVAVPDAFGGEDEVKVFVVLEEGSELDVEALFAYCEQNLPRFAVPRFVEVVEPSAFVRSVGNGSIQKHLLPTVHGSGVVDRLSRARTTFAPQQDSATATTRGEA